MKLDAKAMGLTVALTWGGAVLVVGVLNQVWVGYGAGFLTGVSSVYPGYEIGGFGSVVIGTVWGLLDGFIGGFIVAWLYNRFAGGAT